MLQKGYSHNWKPKNSLFKFYLMEQIFSNNYKYTTEQNGPTQLYCAGHATDSFFTLTLDIINDNHVWNKIEVNLFFKIKKVCIICNILTYYVEGSIYITLIIMRREIGE